MIYYYYYYYYDYDFYFFFFQAEDGIRDWSVNGVQTCALPISVPRSDDRPAIHKRFGIMCLLALSSAHERRAEADGSRHLVDPNHRHDQRFKGDPPFGERPPRELGEPHRHPGLRYEPEPGVPRQGRRHPRIPPRPEHAVAQAHQPEANEEQDPRPQIRQHADPQPRTRQSEERHSDRQRRAFQLATQALALDRREVLEIEPRRERDDQRLETREPRHLRRDERRGREEHARVPAHQPEVAAEREAEDGAHRDRAGEPQGGRPRDTRVQRAGAREEPSVGEDQREKDGDRDVLHDRYAEQRARHGASCVELAHHRHRHGGRRGRREGAEHERHDHRV